MLAVLTGALLFSVSAVKYAGLTLFRIKLLLILAAAPTRCCSTGPRWGRLSRCRPAGTTPRLQLAGALSLGLWLATIVAGRMLGYLD